MNLVEKLKQAQERWAESEAQYKKTFGGEKVAEGTYLAKVTKVRLEENKNNGKLRIAREHIILEGEMKGVPVIDNLQLETPLGMPFARRWLERMGYESPEEIERLIDICEDITKESPTVKIMVKHSGDYINVDVLEVIENIEAVKPNEQIELEVEEVETEPQDETLPVKKTAAKKATPIKKEQEKVRDDDDRINDARDLASAWGISIPKSIDTLPKIRKELSEYEFSRKDCTKSDIALLEELSLEKCIKG